MGFNGFWINNNGKKEVLNNAKHGVRKEQVDQKFHNLFDAYDVNGNGTLENEELGGIFKGLTKFAGADKTLDATENKQIANLFANQAGIEDADFMGFVRSISKATEDIVDSKTTPTADGGREVTTTYKDGTVETISYYPDGEYKFKKIDQEGSTTTNYYTIGDNLDKHYTATEIESRVKKAYQQRVAQVKANPEKNKPVEIIPNYEQFKQEYMQRNKIYQGSDTKNFERHDFELSERGKQDVAVRDFVLSHYIESHKAAHDALESMGILDDVGAAINAGAGELWNSITNVWKGTDEEYQNFYELAKKFEPNYNKSLQLKGTQELAQKHPENYFRGEVSKIDTDNGAKFQQITEQYQNAQILQQRLDILNKAMREISMYQSEQDALTYAPAQSKGMNPTSHILKANNLLLEYFNGDNEAVNMILNGTIGNSEATIKAINGLKEDTEKLNKAVLDGKTFDQIQEDYKSQYKAMYGTDFVPDELTEKVMDAKATGGMVKLAAITAISVLITKSPIMTQMMGAAAGSAEATGAAANMIRTLTARYGATAVQQGIKFAMTSGTLATDVGLTLLNQVTSEQGVNSEELWESTKSSAKYIYFGSYIGAPLAQAVSKQLGKIGATARMFEGGVKTATGGIQTTTITGDKLVQNLMKGGNKVLTTGGAFLTDVAAFTGLEVTTEGQDLLTAGKEQTEMLGKLKIMNHFIEYMLGGKVHAVMSKAKMDAAIEKSGIKNWQIKEIKTPTKSLYEVQLEEGLPPIRFKDANELATAMLERVAENYKGSVPTETPREGQTEVRTTPEVEISLGQRLETANDRESFVAIRDEIEKLPNGEEKTRLMQEYLKKYNEWSADPARHDIRMEYKPLDPKASTLSDLMKDILSDINNAEPISEQTATELHSLLDNSKPLKPEKVDKFLLLIPNEHCAKVLSRYFNKFKGDDWQSSHYFQLISDMKSPENVKELVRIIESPEINENIKTPVNLSYTSFSGKSRDIAASFDVFKKITDAGLGISRNSGVINFKEIDYIMNKITDPQDREFVAKLYTSKLFSRVDFDQLLQMDRETDLTNLPRIEGMMDSYSTLEKMEWQDVKNLLRAPDEILDIISQRNLLKNIPNRKYKFSGNEAIRLAEVDDATWQIILDRKLLEDVPERSDISRPALGASEIKTYAKLSDTEWAKLKSRKLLVYPENIIKSDIISKIARLSDSDYAKIEELVKHANNNVKLLEHVIKETESGTYLDEPMLNYGIQLAKILESSGMDVQRMLTGLNNQDGTFNAECADKLYNFILELKNDNFSIKDITRALQENVRTKHSPDIVTLNWYNLQKRPPFSAEEIDAKGRIYKSMKEFDSSELPEFARAEILQQVNAKTEKFIDKLLHDESLGYSPKSKILNIFDISEDSMGFLAEQDINAARENVLYQREKALNTPDRYVNGEYDTVEDMQTAVNKFFYKQDGKIMLMASIYDKEALNNLLRMRFEDAEEYFDIIHNFEKSELELLQKMSASCNVDGKPFMPTQKIELMDLIQAYHENELPFDKMYSMLEEGNIDIGQLNIDLFNKIMKNSGLTDEEIASIPKEKLTAWDTNFAHLLSNEINSGRDVAFSDVLRAGNLSPDFIQYIHNTENIYGQTNANTRAMYEQMGMDYEHWLKPSKANEIQFLSKDKNAEQLSQIGNQLLEDIETLRATPVKGFLDKQFPQCIKDGKFVIPTEVLTSKAKLNEFTTNLIKQLDSVWKRAQGNLENPQRAANARNTLTILDHFNQRLDDISKVQDRGKATKTLDVTIKMWDRNPQKDIFQGNYSTCCIGMGGGNGSAMPHFVLNTAYNMIELVDNQTGKTIGNALCYFIKGEDGKPAFIIDNIEINNAVRPSEEVGLQLRNSIVEYAARVSKEVTGSEDVPIYMSGSFNDVPCKDLKIHEQKVSFLGDIDCEDIYMDLYNGWVNKEDVTAKLPLLKLK